MVDDLQTYFGCVIILRYATFGESNTHLFRHLSAWRCGWIIISVVLRRQYIWTSVWIKIGLAKFVSHETRKYTCISYIFPTLIVRKKMKVYPMKKVCVYPRHSTPRLLIFWRREKPEHHIRWHSYNKLFLGRFCLLLWVSSDYALPTIGQIIEVTCHVIGRAQTELTPSKI